VDSVTATTVESRCRRAVCELCRHSEYSAGPLPTLGLAEPKRRYSVVENVKTLPRAQTMALDPKTHTLYLSTAEAGLPSGVVTGDV